MDSSFNIKLCDFGLSNSKKSLEKNKDRQFGTIGTPNWFFFFYIALLKN